MKTPFEEVSDNELFGILRNELQKLTEQELLVVSLRFGLIDGTPRTLVETGQRSGGITRERVRNLEYKAFRKLRHRLGFKGATFEEFLFLDCDFPLTSTTKVPHKKPGRPKKKKLREVPKKSKNDWVFRLNDLNGLRTERKTVRWNWGQLRCTFNIAKQIEKRLSNMNGFRRKGIGVWENSFGRIESVKFFCSVPELKESSEWTVKVILRNHSI